MTRQSKGILFILLPFIVFFGSIIFLFIGSIVFGAVASSGEAVVPAARIFRVVASLLSTLSIIGGPFSIIYGIVLLVRNGQLPTTPAKQ